MNLTKKKKLPLRKEGRARFNYKVYKYNGLFDVIKDVDRQLQLAYKNKRFTEMSYDGQLTTDFINCQIKSIRITLEPDLPGGYLFNLYVFFTGRPIHTYKS